MSTVVAPRLLDIKQAALYLGGLSTWTLRALAANGEVPLVRPPDTRGRGERNRRLLFDRADLDALIAKWKVAQ